MQLHPQCLGRFQIDLPVVQVAGDTEFNNTKIRSGVWLTREATQARMDAFEQGLRTKPHKVEPSLLKTTYALPDGKIFVYWKDDLAGGRRSISAWFWRGGRLHVFDTDAAGPSWTQDISSGEKKAPNGQMVPALIYGPYRLRENSAEDAYPDMARALQELVANFVPREPLPSERSKVYPTFAMPPGPGLCTVDGFLSGEEGYEAIEIDYVSREQLDVQFTLSTRTVAEREDAGLLSRSGFAASVLGDLMAQVTTVRKGVRPAGGMAGEELLVTLPNDSGYRAHHFIWEFGGDPDSVTRPKLRIEMITGAGSPTRKDPPPSLSTPEALALWDRMLASLKLRQ